MFSNSLPQLWLYYAVLSLVVLGAGYFAIGFLPRILRWTIVGLVAGAIWMPWYFSSPASVDIESYSGIAPAIIVMALGLLAGHLKSALIGVVIGAVVGGWIAYYLVRRFGTSAARPKAGKKGKGSASAKRGSTSNANPRQDPSI
ncbi:hypothetical protein [Carnimonas bestiolae]|uniref:hypothetical protein n=1 Tax=Carnimonas bestiolae TaxID=3402172 RepID=UPI003EDC8537